MIRITTAALAPTLKKLKVLHRKNRLELNFISRTTGKKITDGLSTLHSFELISDR